MFKYLLVAILGFTSVNAFAGRVTCSSFSTQAEAQAYYVKYNAYWLDGEACECLYGGSKYGSSICRR